MTDDDLRLAVRVDDAEIKQLRREYRELLKQIGPETVAEAKRAAQTIEQYTRVQVQAEAQKRRALEQTLREYQAIARAAKNGSAEQVAANRLAAVTARQLGHEVQGTGLDYRFLSREARAARGELDRTFRGALAGTGVFGGLGRSIAFASTTFLGGYGLAAAARATFDEFTQGDRVMRQTEAIIRSTGGVAGVTAEHIDRLGAAKLRQVGVDDELVKSAANVLLTFTKIRNVAGPGNNIFDQAVEGALDLTDVFEGDLNAAAVGLGKVLQDPVGQLTALQRRGVTFTRAQKELIKELVESNRMLDAQKVILKELDTQVGDASEAYGESLPGAIDRLQQSLLNLAAGAIEDLEPELRDLIDRAQEWIDEMAASGELQDKFNSAFETTKDVVEAVVPVLEAAADILQTISDIEIGDSSLLRLLIEAKLLQSVLRLTGALGRGKGGLATGAAAATAEVGLLSGALATLARTGPITIPILLLLHKEELEKAIDDANSWVNKNEGIRDFLTTIGLWNEVQGGGEPNTSPVPGSVVPDPRGPGGGLLPAQDVTVNPRRLPAGQGRPSTKPHVVDFVKRVAMIYGGPLTITDNSTHSVMTSGNTGPSRRSDHADGNAADIPMSGANLTRLGQAALIAAGMDPDAAAKEPGGAYNVGGVNILFNTTEHWDHLHVGLKYAFVPQGGDTTLVVPDGNVPGATPPIGDKKKDKPKPTNLLPASIRLALSEARAAQASAGLTAGKVDDSRAAAQMRRALQQEIAFLRGKLAGKLDPEKRIDFTDLLSGALGDLAGLDKKKDVRLFDEGRLAELRGQIRFVANHLAQVPEMLRGELRKRLKRSEGVLAGVLEDSLVTEAEGKKLAASAAALMKRYELAIDLKPTIAKTRRDAGEMIEVLAGIPAGVLVDVEDEWGRLVETLDPDEISQRIQDALGALTRAGTVQEAKAALDELEAASALVADAFAEMKDAAEEAARAMDQSFNPVADKTLQAWDAVTAAALRALRVSVQAAGSSFEFGEGMLTPSELALRDLDRADTISQLDQALGSATKRRDKAQARVDRLRAFKISERSNAMRAALEELAAAQAEFDEATKAKQRDDLQQRAETERTAAEEKLEKAKRDYQSERDLQRDHLEKMLEDLRTKLQEGRTTVDGARAELQAIWDKYGIDAEKAGAEIGTGFTTSIAEAISRWATAVATSMSAQAASIPNVPTPPSLAATSDALNKLHGLGQYAPAAARADAAVLVTGNTFNVQDPTDAETVGSALARRWATRTK